jgi:hypothetical protein
MDKAALLAAIEQTQAGLTEVIKELGNWPHEPRNERRLIGNYKALLAQMSMTLGSLEELADDDQR